MSGRGSARFVRSCGQQKEVVDRIDDVLRLHILVLLVALLCRSEWAVQTHVGDFAEDLLVGRRRFIFIRQIILANKLAPK